jgi:hypothetical protein
MSGFAIKPLTQPTPLMNLGPEPAGSGFAIRPPAMVGLGFSEWAAWFEQTDERGLLANKE